MRRLFDHLNRILARPAVFATLVVGTGVAGLAIRLLWLSHAGRLAPISSEMLRTSVAFATKGQIADAYGPGTGLTAHVTPVMPIMVGAIYRLLGVESVTSELVLIAASLLWVGLSLWAVDRAMARLGASAAVRLGGLAAFLLVPLNFSFELQIFRVWEGAVAAAGLAAALAWCLKLDMQAERPSWGQLLLLALAGSAMAMISPPAALAIYGLLGLLAWRRRGFLALPIVAALSALSLVAISYPWAVRNEAIFGEKVWSRTNFGFNFALGFHDAAVHPADPKTVFLNRLQEVDPYSSKDALQALKAAGVEQAYSKLWSARTKAWISAHPGAAAQIAARHVMEFYLPPRWFWSVYSDKAQAVAPRQAIVWGTTILAFLGIAWRLWEKQWRYLYVLGAVVLPAVPYVLAQPVLRYRYVVAALLLYLAVEFLWRLIYMIWANGSQAASESQEAKAPG